MTQFLLQKRIVSHLTDLKQIQLFKQKSQQREFNIIYI